MVQKYIEQTDRLITNKIYERNEVNPSYLTFPVQVTKVPNYSPNIPAEGRKMTCINHLGPATPW